MPVTLGAHHPRLAAARELTSKKGRDARQSFLLEGPTLLNEALACGMEIEAVFTTEKAAVRYDVFAALRPEQISYVTEASAAKLSTVDEPSGIIAVVRQRRSTIEQVVMHEHILVLAGLNDPGNVGTLLRSACAFGVRGILFLEGGVERYNPKVIRSAMGALFRLDCAEISAAQCRRALSDRPVVAADMDGEALDTFRFPPRSAVIIGHERHGIPRDIVQPTAIVSIPQNPAVESLNAGVAGSIVLYVLGKQMRLSSLG